MEYENELTLPLIEHDPTHTLVFFRPHRSRCQVANSICMCMLVVDGIIGRTLHSADGEKYCFLMSGSGFILQTYAPGKLGFCR